MHGTVMFPNWEVDAIGAYDLRGRDAVQMAPIYRTHTTRLKIAINIVLSQDNQRGLATCSGIVYLTNTGSASAVCDRSQVARADTLLGE